MTTPIDFDRPVFCLLGLPFDAVSMRHAVQRLEQARRQGTRCFLSTPNLNFVVAAQRDAAFRDSVCRSDLSVPDGMPLVWIARLLGLPLRERVSGAGLFEALRNAAAPWRVFFFGGTEGMAEQACQALAGAGNGARASMQPAGHLNPGFGSVADMSRREWIEQINRSQPDFVVVSLGAAKGQAWISANRDQLAAPVVSHLGAVVNFVAGSVRRAPLWMQRSGLEWLWRIREEPALWRRYLLDALALNRLLLTRVLPLALLNLTGPSAAQSRRAHLITEPGTHARTLHLHGAWHAGQLRMLRRAFSRLYALPGDVMLDLSDCTWLDSAAVALLLLLDSGLRERGDSLLLRDPPRRLRRLLRLHGAGHLLAHGA